MKNRLSVDPKKIPWQAMQDAGYLFEPNPEAPVEEHNKMVEDAKTKYGIDVWFSAIELVRQQRNKKKA